MRRTWITVAGLGLTAAGLAWALSGAFVQREVAPPTTAVPSGPGRLVVDLVDGSTNADLAAVAEDLGAPLTWTHPLAQDEALAFGEVPDLAAAVARLRQDPRVEVVEPAGAWQLDPMVSEVDRADVPATAGWPNDPLYPKQWHLRRMGAPAGWERGARGQGVIVAVVDTGVTPVEDLEASRVLTGASFVPGVRSARDDQGHGTHVAGTIAQTTHNGKGVAGVAPKATILPVKVLSAHGSGQSDWIAAGIDYAVDEGAQVINLSLGGSYSAVIHNAVRKAREQGVLVIAAAGNSGRRGVSWPGALREAIGVGAIGPAGDRAPYSSFGPGVDIVAPGGDTRIADGGVLQDTVGPGGVGHRYAAFQGTSMATPHVAGAAAVLLSSGMSPKAVEAALLESATGAKNEERGHGELDLGRALVSRFTWSNLVRFFLGAGLAWALASLSLARGWFVPLATVVGAVVAGGLFFLPWIPGGMSVWTGWAAGGFLELPATWGWPSWVHFPLWCSALGGGLAGLFLGAFRPTRVFALGLNAGLAAHLFHATVTGEIQPWWLGGTWGPAWLAAHATGAALIAMSLAGAEKLDRETR